MARLLVWLRGRRALIFGGDRTGLTVACRGCADPSPHDAHLALGAMSILGWRR